MSFDQLPIELVREVIDECVQSRPPFLQLRLLCRRVDSIIVEHLLAEAGFYTGSLKWDLHQQPLTRSKIEMAARLTRERIIRAKLNSQCKTGVTDQNLDLSMYQLALAYAVVGSLGTGAGLWECPAVRGFETIHAWGLRLSCPHCADAREMKPSTPGANVNFNAGKVFGRPLHVAAFAGHDAAVRLLLEHGANPNLQSFKGYTALHLVAIFDRASTVQILLDGGADPNKKDGLAETPLLYAALAGHSGVTKVLLARDGTNPNLADGDMHRTPARFFSNVTPIFGPTINGNETILKLLLSRPDVAVNIYNSLGLTAMADAIVAGQEALTKLFVTRKDLAINAGFQDANVSFLERDCPVLLACYVGLTEVVRAVLARDDVDVNCYTPRLLPMLGEEVVEHATPLALAVMGGRKEIVELLIKHPKIKPNLEDSNGYSPVVSAVVRGHVPTSKTLMKHPDIEINSSDWEGRTPLIEAVSGEYEAIVQILCQSEFLELDGEDSTGQTALMIAASLGNERMVAMLLSNEFVETHQENSDGVTALAVAAESGHVSIVKRLLKHPGFGNEGPKKRHLSQALLKATMYQHFNVIGVLRDYIKTLPKDAFHGVSSEHPAESEFESDEFEPAIEFAFESASSLNPNPNPNPNPILILLCPRHYFRCFPRRVILPIDHQTPLTWVSDI